MPIVNAQVVINNGAVQTVIQPTIPVISLNMSAYNGGGTFFPGNLTTGTTGVSITGGTGAVNGNVNINIQTADGSHTGLLSSSDWTVFNNKLSTIAGISASGDLSGTYPGPTVSKLLGNAIPSNASGVLTNDGLGGLSWGPAGTTYTADETTLHLTGTQFSIISTYPGQSSITTLGTISTGIWQSTKIGLQYGGTNADLSATGGTSQVLKQTTVGGNITVGQLASSDLSDASNIAYINAANVFTNASGQAMKKLLLSGSTSGTLTVQSPTISGSNTLTFPAGTTDFSSTGGAGQYVKQSTSGGAFTVGTIPASDIGSGQAISKTDDTNVTLTLGGGFASALLSSSSLTLGWAGTLAYSRFVNGAGLSVVGRSTNSPGVQADIIGTANQVLVVNGAGTTLGFGSIDLTASVGSSILPIANGGTNASSFTSGSVIYFDGTKFNQDNNNFFWNSGSHILSVNTSGDQSGTDSINAYNQIDAYLPNSSQGAITASGGTSGFTASSSRGTGASPSNLAAADLVGGFSMWGYTNSAYTNVAGAFAYVTGSTSTNLGGEYRIYTKADGGALTQRFTIDNAGRAKVNSGGLDITGVGTTTGVGFNYINSGSGTVLNILDSGLFTHNASLGTVGANNVYGLTSTVNSTSRNTVSDAIGTANLTGTVTVNSTNIDSKGLLLNTVFSQTGVVASGGYTQHTTANFTGSFPKTATVSPTGGSGTGLSLNVTVSSATSITINSLSSGGTGYKVGDVVTITAAMMGLSTGSVTYFINALSTVSLNTQAAQLILVSPSPDGSGLTNRLIDGRTQSGSSIFSIEGFNGGIANGVTPNVRFNDRTGQVWSSSATSSTWDKNIIFNGTVTMSGGALSIGNTITSTANQSITTSSTIFNNTGTVTLYQNNIVASTYSSSASITTGVIQSGTYTTAATAGGQITNQGTGGTNGTYSSVSLTGGTGSGAKATFTVSGNVVTQIVFSTGNQNQGTGYTNGDILSASSANIGGVTGFQFTVGSTDPTGAIWALGWDNRTLTDAHSGNQFISYYSAPTINQTGTSNGDTYFGKYDPTYTATLGNRYGLVIVPGTAKNGFGLAAPTATVHISQSAMSSGWFNSLSVQPGAHTALTAATEFISSDFKGATQTWVDGTTATQRFNYFRGFTLNKTTTSATFTNAYTVYVDPSTAGSGVTITNNYALGLNGALKFVSSGIAGYTDASTASSGIVGEEISATQSTYTNYTTTATYQNITSITLTAGDWDISAVGTFSGNSATLTTTANAIFVISTTTASAAGATEGVNLLYIDQNVVGSSKQSVTIPRYRVSISSSTTYFLNSQSTFTAGNPQFVGSIRARRVR